MGASVWTPRYAPLPIEASEVNYNPAAIYPEGTVGNYLSSAAVSVKKFGARGDNSANDSAAIQRALDDNSLRGLFIPPGLYRAAELVFPDKYDFDIFGCGSSSSFVQIGPHVIGWPNAFTTYRQSISNVGFIGTNGSDDTLKVIGQSNITLQNLSFLDVPIGFSSIYADGYAGTYIHDMRIEGLRIYSTTAGRSGVRLGPLTSDQQINNFIMNGSFVVDYCLETDPGATTLQVTNSHPYNAKINILKMRSGSILNQFTSVRFDNALGTLVDIAGMSGSSFVNCLFQAVRSGQHGVRIQDSINNEFDSCQWQGASGAAGALIEIGTSNNNKVVGGQLYDQLVWTAPWTFVGNLSYADRIFPYYMGRDWSLPICGNAAQAANTTEFYGLNGKSTAPGFVEYVIPENCILERIWLAVNTLPGAGQTYTFQCLLNGVNFGAPLVINNSGAFEASSLPGLTAARNSVLTVRCVTSATAAPVVVRGNLQFRS